MEQSDDHARSSDEKDEMYCELCKVKGRSKSADGFCVDCVKYFCSNFLDFHSEFLPNHVQQDKNTMPKDVCIKPCYIHADKIIKFYCSACEQFFCYECKQTNHLDCTSVSHLPAFVKGIDISKECNAINEKLRNTLKEIDLRQSEAIRKTQAVSEYAGKAKSELLMKITAVLEWLNRNVVNIEQEIEEIQKADELAVQSEGAHLSACKIQTLTLQTEFNNKTVLANRCELFMVTKETEIQQKQIELKLKQFEDHALTCYEVESSDDFERLIGETSMRIQSKKMPDIEMQKSSVKECLQSPLIQGELWYVVHIKWFKQWKSYVGYDKDNSHAGDKSAHPGSIDNTPILQERTSKLKERLIDDLDYILIPEDCWKQLLVWYRMVDEQDPLPRKVIEEGVYTKSLKVEVYPWWLKLCEHTNPDKQLSQSFSRSDSIGYLEKIMRYMFGISADRQVRLWNRYKTNMYEQLKEKDFLLQDAGLYQGQVVIEQQNVDGSWPRDYSFKTKTKNFQQKLQ